MIARTWHGAVPADLADEYYDYLKRTGLADYKNTTGNRGIQVLRRTEGEVVHFLLVTFWDSMEAIQAFAGEDVERARYYPEDEQYLIELEPKVTHYEVLTPKQTTTTGIATIQRQTTVKASPDRAFEIFVKQFAAWWPPEYTWSQETLQTIGIEPRKNGLCFEHGPHGFRCDWGRVLVWEPPHRIVFSWQISPERVPEPNPDKASKVDIRFTAEADGTTRLDLEHRGFERHGEHGDSYRAGLASEQGWSYILQRFAEAV